MKAFFSSLAHGKVSLALLALSALLLAPLKLHATSITYDLVLTDSAHPTYSGTGVVTFDVVPTQTYIDYSADVTSLSFTIDGNTFNLSDPGAGLTAFEFSNLSPTATIWDITFADQIGTTDRLTLHSTSGYTYYYDNNTKSTNGVFGAATVATSPAPTPEPGSIFLLGTGLLGGAGELFRRIRLQRS